MNKYDSDTKLAAIHAYLEGDIAYKRTAQKMGVSTTMLKKWVANFREHGITAFKDKKIRNSKLRIKEFQE